MNESLRKRLNISRWAIKHPRLTISFWLAVAVAGLLAFSSLKYALFPDVTFPVVIIRAEANLENVLETETKLTNPLEKPLREIGEIEEIYSSTFAGESVINILFLAGDSLTEATTKIKQAIAPVALPEGTNIEVIPYNLNESTAISYTLTSETLGLRQIAEVAETKIIPALDEIKGILQVNLLGISSETETTSDNRLSRNLPSLVRWDGKKALAIQVVKTGKANTLEVVESVKNQIEQLRTQLTDVEINLAQTEADYIEEATQATINSLVVAIILAILVVYPFVGNFSATLITAIAIPLSLLGTCIIMAGADFNLETITLLALALVIGIVVDDAIVDVENIKRHLDNGETPKQASIKGTDEIGLTVSASTLTIVAVFLPVALMRGNLGQFFQPFGLTVSAAVIISLLVARTLSPVLAMLWLKPKYNQHQSQLLLLKSLANFGNWVLVKYHQLLAWSLVNRWLVVNLALVTFMIGIALIPFIPQGFIPRLDRGEFNIIYTSDLPKIPQGWQSQDNNHDQAKNSTATNSSFSWLGNLKENPRGFLLRRTRRIGEKIEAVVLDYPDVESTFNIVGFRGQPNKGKIYVKLKDERQSTTMNVQQTIRDSLPEIKGANISVEEIKFVDTGDERPFSLRLQSDNLVSLYATADQITQKLKQLPSLTDLTSSATIARLDQETDLLSIDHLNHQRAVRISANLTQNQALGDVIQEATKIINPLLPPDVKSEWDGDSARMEEVVSQFLFSFGLSIVLMLLVLWGLFSGLLEPLVVGLALPLSIVGAMLALLTTQNEFGMISFIGIVFLLGLLDKNALLLVDYAKQLESQGIARTEAILKTGMVRLRPILMTTCSTILGMLPLAIGWGAGAELRQPMAVVIIGGLITGSLLTLIFVPVCYSLLKDLRNRMTKSRINVIKRQILSKNK